MKIARRVPGNHSVGGVYARHFRSSLRNVIPSKLQPFGKPSKRITFTIARVLSLARLSSRRRAEKNATRVGRAAVLRRFSRFPRTSVNPNFTNSTAFYKLLFCAGSSRYTRAQPSGAVGHCERGRRGLTIAGPRAKPTATEGRERNLIKDFQNIV